MMEMILLPLICLVVGAVGGYWLCAHIHSVAAAAVRATTIPSGHIDALNNAVAGLGNTVKALNDKVQAATVDKVP